jgi:hypothetical protein
MTMKFWLGALVVCVGCGEVTAEPIRSASLAITRVDIDAEDSQDPYACEVVSTDSAEADELQVFPFVRVGELGYAGRCQNAEQTTQCWYTGNTGCERAGGDCGGFSSSIDTQTGEYQLAGGQHMLCPHPCVRDDECPASATGTARPSCMLPPDFNPATDGGTCMLGCGAGETCPDGFVCIQPGLSFSSSDGTNVPAPAQCVQFHRLTLHGDPMTR